MKKLIFTSFLLSFIACSAQAQQLTETKKNQRAQAALSKTQAAPTSKQSRVPATQSASATQSKVSITSDNVSSTPSPAFSTTVAQTNAALVKTKREAAAAQPANNKTTPKSKVKKG